MLASEGGARGKGKDQDFELNLASIIDCFTVLITYLLVSASFIALGVFDVSVVSSVASTQNAPGQTVDVTVEIDDQRNIRVRLSGTETGLVSIPPQASRWDYEAMGEALQKVKAKWPDLAGVVLAASTKVEYRDLVTTIERIRQVVPNVALGDPEEP